MKKDMRRHWFKVFDSWMELNLALLDLWLERADQAVDFVSRFVFMDWNTISKLVFKMFLNAWSGDEAAFLETQMISRATLCDVGQPHN